MGVKLRLLRWSFFNPIKKSIFIKSSSNAYPMADRDLVRRDQADKPASEAKLLSGLFFGAKRQFF
jgi:hypothetical protein